MLELIDLTAGYNKNIVIRNINIYIEDGEIVALIGRNGSGKSTMLKAAMGLINVNSGSILLNGIELVDFSTRKRIMKGLSYIPQGRSVFLTLSVQENLDVIASEFLNKKLLKERINLIYDIFPFLMKDKNRTTKFLSGGEQQCLSLAMALLNDPSALLIDEPTLGLDQLNTERFEIMLKEIAKNRKGILIAEQNERTVKRISARVYEMDLGEIYYRGSTKIYYQQR